jgi:hypothetical protein
MPTGRLRVVRHVGRRLNVEQAEMTCIAGHVWWSSHPNSVATAKLLSPMNKPCTCCGATANVQSVALCPVCQAAPRIAAVVRKLSGPIDWYDIVGTVLYDKHGRAVATVRNLTFSSHIGGLFEVHIEGIGVNHE